MQAKAFTIDEHEQNGICDPPEAVFAPGCLEAEIPLQADLRPRLSLN